MKPIDFNNSLMEQKLNYRSIEELYVYTLNLMIPKKKHCNFLLSTRIDIIQGS